MDDDVSGRKSVVSRNAPAYRPGVFSAKTRQVDRDKYNSGTRIVAKRETASPEGVMDARGKSRVCSERYKRTKPAKVHPSIAVADNVILVGASVSRGISTEDRSDFNSSGSSFELCRGTYRADNGRAYNYEEYEALH